MRGLGLSLEFIDEDGNYIDVDNQIL
jgi:hypothetical protein